MKLPFAGRLLAVAMLAAASAALPVSSAFAATPEKPKVALVMKSLANEFFLTMEDGAKAYQKDHSGDFELISNGIKDETDTAGQTRIVEQMILSKVNALVIAPADSKAMVPVIKKAVDAGITVINIDNQLDPAVVKSKNITVPFVGPDNRKGARLVGEYLAKQLKAGDEVGIIEGVSTTTNAQQRTAGFKDAMEAAQIKVVSLQSGDWEIDKGGKVASSMLSEYPNIKALLAGNDSMAVGAVSAVRAAGKAGKVQVVGYDNINAIKPMLKDGRVLATADQFAARQAVFGIETALKIIKGEKVDSGANGVIETPVELVTK
ncbi:ribose transport system substrate-binding protein [Pseudomonas frederiksbergensis]|jgi:ribose transport system substrate-binding protein|uniref:Sugar ABC transporter substrate-binding protein n=1 Tax=Pseudomonas frederiksbergensis TaxID=104087 RepID=A0AB33EF60_9PSED|nr:MULTISPECIES: sugar ABC transporter substrate-binding protein [Pseudomonas]ATE78829.1 sugar ABC transporter substrate-binding protein [Pseudomonas frederiksbergensis]MBD9607310.1 sugar ABC transporter substrate-binding protein [Pseudomonas sp. PDM08]MBD9616716.1 sugar ABC transporter substrate-binding protein [Pseudomonas sp. PDM07]MDR7109272.1 ribose transport system substrate-binding protein [Pseudomonas frederiksbergensis]PZW52414.1 monosaccharide ABC transporter substrate-binding protei